MTEVAEGRPSFAARHVKQLLLLLKVANLGAITAYQFALIFVLIRTVGPTLYPWLIFMAAIGNYVLSADLGFSGFVYADVRRNFIDGLLPSRLGFVNHALLIYISIALGASAVAAIAITLLPGLGVALKVALTLYFLATVLGLPWTLIRRIATAVDQFVAIEIIELARRVVMLIVAAWMLNGLGFSGFAVLSVVIWIVAFAAAFVLIAKRGIRVRRSSPRILAGFIAENRSGLFLTGGLTSLDFAIYNFPYMLIPVLFGSAAPLVVYDLFYKICRFGGTAFSVALETALPFQTRAFHAGNLGEVKKYQRSAIALGLIPLIGASALLLLFGQRLFAVLLNHAVPIDREITWTMVFMLAAILFQAAAGTFLGAIGKFSQITRLAMGASIGMTVLTLVTFVVRLSFDTFMAAYVVVYIGYAIVYQMLFHRVVTPATQDAARAELTRR
ncbi:hypothetical protein [Sphingomonas sp. PP-CC-3A-396]|uniref:hypothetical protein n=1 Tax=Sphingomonas sp. PP-CC-3A-396 TaxID=2135655 RepID=UPI0010526B60|nr:hypothetical protein [Sphingomonas sp. PP-CC-3A-396]TCQ03023.1 hypothetical protein C8J40_11319 [Sphingomonas sp. PP-CC-3A-396]